MPITFVNRTEELAAIGRVAKKGGLVVVFGRRHIGKTRMLTRWFREHARAAYSQAIEGPRELQLEQVMADLSAVVASELVPRSWTAFFELLSLHAPRALCLDEFPYLVASDPSLPSILQKWIDHSMPSGMLLVLSGSSQGMMHDLVLKKSAPLFGRATNILRVEPMSYGEFCEATNRSPCSLSSFELFSVVGGVPRYWELLDGGSVLDSVERLYFGFSPFFEEEPSRLLRDAGVIGSVPLSLLEVIGRGASRPSEMAARLGTTHGNLTRPLELLRDASLIVRELPFGESPRSTKRTLYRIDDPSLRFWFSVQSPHRTRWQRYGADEKRTLIHQHGSVIFEDWIRQRLRTAHPDAGRYWEAGVELDVVYEDEVGLVVGEVKFKRLAARERDGLKRSLSERFHSSRLSAKYKQVRFEVFDLGELDAERRGSHRRG